jgi:hypothetical protein
MVQQHPRDRISSKENSVPQTLERTLNRTIVCRCEKRAWAISIAWIKTRGSNEQSLQAIGSILSQKSLGSEWARWSMSIMRRRCMPFDQFLQRILCFRGRFALHAPLSQPFSFGLRRWPPCSWRGRLWSSGENCTDMKLRVTKYSEIMVWCKFPHQRSWSLLLCSAWRAIYR